MPRRAMNLGKNQSNTNFNKLSDIVLQADSTLRTSLTGFLNDQAITEVMRYKYLVLSSLQDWLDSTKRIHLR